MALGAAQAPIKIGLLFDFAFPPPATYDLKADWLAGLRLGFTEAVDAGYLDRDVTLIERSVEGLPRGEVKVVVDAWQELADEGCLAIIGPMVSENASPVRDVVERGGFVPTLSWGGTDDWLGEWTFSHSDGNLNVESYCIALLAKRSGHHRVGVTYERSVIGREYLAAFETHAAEVGIDIVRALPVAQTESDVSSQVKELELAAPDAIVHLGFGLAMVKINAVLAAIGWDPPRYMNAAWENVFLSDDINAATRGWIGLDHYDEENLLGQSVVAKLGDRGGCHLAHGYALYGYDLGRILSRALMQAKPLSPRGVRDGLERVRMLPSAGGSEGSTLSFGPFGHRAWQDGRYLTAREVDAEEFSVTHLRGRFI